MTLERFQMCIGGEWVDALSGKTFDSLNPALGEEVGWELDRGAETCAHHCC